MIKNILFLTLISSFCSLSAQSIFLDNPPSTASGPADNYIQVTFDVINTSSSNVNVKVKRIILSEVAGTENNFCWGTACYPPFVDESPDALFFSPGDTTSTFKADYTPLGNDGESIIKYCFFNDDDHADSVCTTIRFTAMPVGINEQSAFVLSPAFPNPANDYIGIKYKMDEYYNDASILFYNVVGVQIDRINLHEKEGTVVFPVNQLSPGVYFYSINSKGRNSISKKFVVK
ncbi:MAG: T9SS type A sorting domain-containing protein [Bacteroidota bacterium]|nr:T9SS type A sorting domain-containing protein [Bacteroidota bacterium]